MSVLAQTAGPHRVGRVMPVVGVPMLLGPAVTLARSERGAHAEPAELPQRRAA